MNSGPWRHHLRRVRAPFRSVDLDLALQPLRRDPRHTAILLDIDGTLATIVPDPTKATIPAATRSVLRRLQVEYLEVGIVTGRRPLDARRIVGLDADYFGNHGLEHLAKGTSVPVLDPGAAAWLGRVRDFVDKNCTAALLATGVRVEDKEIVITLHWRGARDEAAAKAAALAVAAVAAQQGLTVQHGRGIVEVKPPVPIDKGTAVRRILDAHPGVKHVVYAGDDRTDVDAMRLLGQMRAGGRLTTVVRVGVVSSEVPLEILENSDVLVAGPRGVRRMLRRLQKHQGPHLPLAL